MYPRPPFQGAKPQETPGLESKMDPQPDYGKDSYHGTGKLKGQVAIITGGDSGIGRAVAVAYAKEGADVAISYLNEDSDAEQTKKVVEDAGRKCLLIPGDISDEAQCKKIVDQTLATFGKIDILVNNAAFQGKSVKKFEELDHDRVLHTFKTNIVAMFDLVRLSLPHMKPGGAIINVGSIQAYQPSENILDYACTKAAIVGLTKGLALESIERRIRTNCVAPGPIWTPLIVQSFDEEKVKNFGKQSPTGRPGQPVELAPAFVFLASSDSSYVNGMVFGITGGEVLA